MRWKKLNIWKVPVMLLVITVFLVNSISTVHGENAETQEIVDPYQTYTYELMTDDLNKLAAAYPDLIQIQSIGTTAYGRDIKAVKLGKGEASVLIDGSQHAREWMGTNLILYMIDRYAYAYVHNMKYDNYMVRQLLDNCSIWFVPMVNPDGVTLQQSGLSAFPEGSHSWLLSMNGGSHDFKRWKANAEGIDINRQYPAVWTGIVNSPQYPMYKNYKGSEPAETTESQSMIRFTYAADPEIALSYHASGHILYWYFYTAAENMERDRSMAAAISRTTGYSMVKPEKYPSGGGFTDWFIAQFGRPGFTAELGPYQEETELPDWTFTDIWSENQTIGLYLASEGYKLWRSRYPVETADIKLQLLEAVKLYNRPNESFQAGAEVPAGKATSDARMGDWYRISTWLGPKWIHLNTVPYLQGHSEKYDRKITLTEDTSLYKYPAVEMQQPLGILKPQEVQALERWNDWILIHTWTGDFWVRQKP